MCDELGFYLVDEANIETHGYGAEFQGWLDKSKHPAYLPEFPGAHAVRDAIAAGATETGASIIVVADGVDDGPIIVQERVPVLTGDDEHALHERIKPVERRLLVQTVIDIANGLDLEAL